jgi:hypothetical protein
MSTPVESPHVDFYLPFVVMPDNPVDDLGYGYMLGLSLSPNAGDEWLLDVQGPSFGGSGSIICLGQQVLTSAPPGQHVVEVREVGEGEIDVDGGSTTRVDFGGSTDVYLGFPE